MNTEQIVILKVFEIKNEKRKYKPKSQHKADCVNDAYEYVRNNGIYCYDISVNGVIIDRDGNGSVEKQTKKEKKPTFITEYNEEEIINKIKNDLQMDFVNHYPLKTGSGMIALYMKCNQDANKVYLYLKNSVDFKILDIVKKSLAISFETTTEIFKETKQWKPKAKTTETTTK